MALWLLGLVQQQLGPRQAQTPWALLVYSNISIVILITKIHNLLLWSGRGLWCWSRLWLLEHTGPALFHTLWNDARCDGSSSSSGR
jgi:hypothetical protein